MVMNCQFISIYGKFATPLSAYYSCEYINMIHDFMMPRSSRMSYNFARIHNKLNSNKFNNVGVYRVIDTLNQNS